MTLLKKTLISAAFLSAFAATALLTATAFAQTAAARVQPPLQKPAFPAMRLMEMSNGERAIGNLGNRLPEVAAYYGKTVAEFAQQLRTDRSAWIDKSGRLMFIEHGLTVSGSDLAPGGAIYPADQTFKLHSRPGSKRKIYLDFNGHTTTGSAWNSSYGLTTITSPAFDLDGLPGTYSAAELAMIQNIWRRVAEDYAAFDVDVTTEEPPLDQMTRTALTDDTYGARALITRNFTAGTTRGDCGCGGFAYVGVFDNVGENYKTAFVFQDKLANGEKNIAEAVTHEVGHNLGLSHDGTGSTGYYTGHGTGVTGWAPIMGVGYSRELVQFSKGEYLNANNKEDDFLVMQNNGVVFAADDFGNTIATATVLAATPANGVNSYSIRGLVETPSDMDFFKFSAGAGTLTVNATPFERSPNLDILMQVRDGNGTVIAQANPLDALNGTISMQLPAAGNYYLSIQGTGKGDPLGTGYSVYGSIGRYSVSMSAPVTAGMPVASISTSATSGPAPLLVSFSGAASSDPSGTLQSYEWNFGDGSAPVAGATASHSYAAAGSYSATLKVTNASGMTDTRAVTITATSVQPRVYVDAITLTTVATRNGNYAQAKITVKDTAGRAIQGATVTGNWSGIVSSTKSAGTNTAGIATVNSPLSKVSGTYQYAVTGIAAPGFAYDAALNKMTSNAITR
ncbi:PKD domain-containing protein [Massilia sp. PAMC28688]|uniref:PKD domain-containing protein n=1 Tax=Massilia sp. PAMC28688 TaxID=2861283 RepID=UPI001C626986|nr:PKD domain-containing protein [Massilia sp. PAMC28688]QYF94574.1 PKD domain-containing protein [Massilia sp. PAMC28688]